jgi:tetratricopeptide (TPR) repeat protein
LNDAALLAASPWSDDIAAIDMAQRPSAWVEILELRALVLADSGNRIQALVEQGTADNIAGRHGISDIADRLSVEALPDANALKSRYSAPGAETALAQARQALADEDPLAAATHAMNGMFLYAWANPRDWREACAEGHQIQARAFTDMGEHQAALVSWSHALTIWPEAPADWWAAAAAEYEELGYLDAAFARYATARTREAGDSVPDEALVRTHIGLGDALVAALAAATPIPYAVPQEEKSRVARGILYRFKSSQPVGSVNGSISLGDPPKIGSKMPSWSVEGLNNAAMKGRTYALIFWTTDCTACLKALHEAGDVARDLRRSARDVAVVAVSMDPEQSRFEDVRRMGKTRVTLVRDPELGFRLGVEDVPTIWIVDQSGTVQYYSTAWPGERAFERALRRSLADQ